MRFQVLAILLCTLVSIDQGASKVYFLTKSPEGSDGHTKFDLSAWLGYISSVYGNDYEKNNIDEVSVLTWNILLDSFINETELGLTGMIDLNLLNTNLRLMSITEKILQADADIVNLQEVELETYIFIKNALKKVYGAVPFVAHEGRHWDDVVPDDKEYVANGFATFYKKEKFRPIRYDKVLLSENGNVALVTTLKLLRKSNQIDSAFGPPIISANIHFQHGGLEENVLLRIVQGNALLKWIEAELAMYKSKKPIVMISGDFNSIVGFPSIDNLENNDYADVSRTFPIGFSFVAPKPIEVPGENRTIEVLFFDRLMLRKEDVNNGRAQFKSVEFANITTSEFSEKTYISRQLDLLTENIQSGNIDIVDGIESLRLLLNSLNDDREFDTRFNRAVRQGSDHLPVIITVKLDL